MYTSRLLVYLHACECIPGCIWCVVQVFGEKGVLLCENICDDPVLHFSDSGCSASLIQYSFPQR